MTPFTLYVADCRGVPTNTTYPRRVVIDGEAAFRQAMSLDHVAAEYKGFHRANKDFVAADCLMMDCDNTHSDKVQEWKTPQDVQAAFPGVEFAVCYSRNHMKEKDGKAPRPKFHVYFKIEPMTDAARYKALKETAIRLFPWFDVGARDAARFFFGVDNPQVEYFEGDINLSDFLNDRDFDIIPEGRRNSTLSQFAGCVLKRHGDSDEARRRYDEKAAQCSPPLEDTELSAIWNSALAFYRNTVQADPGYIPPEDYGGENALEPPDYTDVGEALVLAREYGDILRYSAATQYLYYNGQRWEENEIKARGTVQELTERQLAEARAALFSAHGVSAAADAGGDKGDADKRLKAAKEYMKFTLKRRDTGKITATMREVVPLIEISVDELDAEPFLLNTPGGTVDLKTGEMQPHSPKDYITKITTATPGAEGAELWAAHMEKITCGDKELADFIQQTAGQAAVGRVYNENLIMGYGGGGNGKSTVFNPIAMCLGDYSGSLSAETLTTNCRQNKSPEYAELRGKRLVIAAELEEGQRLDTAAMKKLCSTDRIYAAKKFKDPFDFVPSHTTILYTNHLPKVGTSDAGTWRRIIVIPFNAEIKGDGVILNYGEYLYEHAGGAILTWVIEGAKKYIANDFKITMPQCVKQAVAQYQDDNDWFTQFFEACCAEDKLCRTESGELNRAYRDYCIKNGEFARHAAALKEAMGKAGFQSKRTARGVEFVGVRLTEFP